MTVQNETTWSQVVQKDGKQEKTGNTPANQEVKDLTASRSSEYAECEDCNGLQRALDKANEQIGVLLKSLEETKGRLENLQLECTASKAKVTEYERILAFPKVNNEGFRWKTFHEKHADYVPLDEKWQQLSKDIRLEYEESRTAQKLAWKKQKRTPTEEANHKKKQPPVFENRNTNFEKLKKEYIAQRPTIEVSSEELTEMHEQIVANHNEREKMLAATTEEIVQRSHNTMTQQNYLDDFIKERTAVGSSTYSSGAVSWDPNSYLEPKKALLEEKNKKKNEEVA